MKVSIRMKITLMVVAFSTFVIGATWILCSFFIEEIFVINVKDNLESTYDSCNSMFNNTEYKDVDDGALYGSVMNSIGSVVLILDNENGKIYTSINDEGKMMDSMDSMLRSIYETMGEDFYAPGTFAITENYDSIIDANYYDLVGRLDNGNIIIVRAPVSQVETIMRVLTKIFIYIAIGLIGFGSIFILVLSNIFSAPIKRLNHVAKRMTQLDFDVKYQVDTSDEIGELGTSMNNMSKKLEETISELKSANIELEKDIEEKKQIDEVRKEFLSHVSHELKTPIALIQGYAEGLKDNLFDDQESKDFYTDVIIDEAQKMNIMVKKLLNLNEIESGQTPIKVERFELVEFIRDIIEAKKILLKETDVKIEFNEEAPVYVWADEYMIEEAFTNYLTNAIHYVAEDGVIKVFFEKRDRDIRINVYNQGKQISQEDIDKLFIKFYKADKARTREYGGSGIGLSIVAATMKAHGKNCGVYNVEDGVVFYFDLDANMPC